MLPSSLTSLSKSYVAFSASFQLLFWVPVIYEIYRIFGLSPDQIFTIQSHYYFAFLLLELPTGWISDRISRKKIMMVAASVLTVVNLIPLFSVSFQGFWLQFIGIALARSLLSGASSAYLFDHLKKLGKEDFYSAIEAKARSASLVLRLLCWSLAGFLLIAPLSLFGLSSAAGFAALIIAAKYLPADEFDRPLPSKQKKLHPSNSRRLASLLPNRFAFSALLQGIVLFVLMRLMMVNLFQPLLESKSIGPAYYGIVLAGVTLAEATSSYLCAGKFNAENRYFYLVGAALPLSFIGAGMSNPALSLAFMIFFGLLAGFILPLQKQLINNAIGSSNNRASWLSVESLIQRLICGLAVIPIATSIKGGMLASYFNYAGIIAIAISIFSFLLSAEGKKASLNEVL